MQVNLTIPTTWNQLTPTQLTNIVHQIHCFQTIIKDNAEMVTITSAKLYLQIAKELLRGNKWADVQKALKEIQPKEFLPWSDFLYKSVERTKFIPAITHNEVTYHPPAQRIRNTVIAEFAFADAAWYQWNQTKRIIWLDVLCATLYREEAKEPSQSDNRIPFVKQAVDERADRLEKLPFKTKLAIATCYEGCRNHIAKTYPTIFPKPPEKQESKTPIKQKYVSFGKMIIAKLDGDPSKLEQTNNVNTYDFLNIMANDIENARKNRKK